MQLVSTRSFSENYDALKDFAKDAPLNPGVYLWKDSENRIIYVGKARVLRHRLKSYFSGAKDIKTTTLIRQAASIESIIVSNEYEALLLENTLIKQHSPKYNISLKDGKTYPMVRITGDKFPRVFRTRHLVEDGSMYFGPFANIPAVDRTLELIKKTFQLRKCKILKPRKYPCMYYHINMCLAPCIKETPEYEDQVEQVRKLLSGESEALVNDLTAKMQEAAQNLKFEEAATLRNAITAIESLNEKNTVQDMDKDDRDYIAWVAEGIFTTFSVLSMRGGRMTGQELFSSRSAAEEDETLDTFIAAYYTPDRQPPPQIFVGVAVANLAEAATAEKAPPSFEAVRRYFEEQFNTVPELVTSSSLSDIGAGEQAVSGRRHLAALAMARQNAAEELRRRLRERGAGPALDELKRALNLKTRPERIEGFDIAQLNGKHPVASLVSFKNGAPDRKNYRYFKLKSVVGIVDDFAAVREAVHRRYSRLMREGKELPDLVLIDGGIGQVNAAKGVLDELGMPSNVAGLAKRDEEIWLPHASAPIRLSRRSEALKVLQFLRDETHRFATGLNQRLRSGDLHFSILESVEGIGHKRAAALIKAYGDLEHLAAAEPAAIAETCRINEAAAQAVRAAARLALEDTKAAKLRLAGRTLKKGKAANTELSKTANLAALALEDTAATAALVAEGTPGYGEEG